MASIDDFNTGSGMGENAATELSIIFMGSTLALAGAWCTWVFYKAFRAWAGGRLGPHETVSICFTSLVILTIFIVIFSST